ncbi:hypothetical protein [Sphingomonas hankookensis]|uniref:hypothetical protein n=1 Tax=Sphingomonas hankookensis TaxID=563996 RepID=UPI003D303006
MIESFFLSVAQLGDRAFLRVLAKSLAVTLVLLAAVGAGLAWGRGGSPPTCSYWATMPAPSPRSRR